MKLLAEWRRILRHAWSVRMAVLAAIFSTGEAVLPFVANRMPIGLFATLALVASLGSIVARIVAQKDLT